MLQQHASRVQMCGWECSTQWMGCHIVANPPSCCLSNKSISTGIYDNTVNIHVHANSLVNCVAITCNLNFVLWQHKLFQRSSRHTTQSRVLVEPWAGEPLHSSKLSSPIRNTTFHDTHTLPIYIILTPHHFYLQLFQPFTSCSLSANWPRHVMLVSHDTSMTRTNRSPFPYL